MSWVSEIKGICGDYMIDVKYHEKQKEAITLFFNSRRNAETVKRCIELDDSVPNVATAVDFVEVVRCRDCIHWGGTTYGFICRKFSGIDTKICMGADHYCSYGERSENGK